MKKLLLATTLFLAVTSLIYAQGFLDDFESYNTGEQLVVQNPNDWTTWSNTPGSDEDPYVQNLEGNAVNITGINDLVYEIPNWTNGFHWIEFDLYIPTGSDAYFNTLQEFNGAASQWGMQAYFGHTNMGEGNIDGGGALAQIFNFQYDVWLEIKVEIDLDNDWAEFFIFNNLIHGWVWSNGAFGTNNLNQLGGSNFYGWSDGVYTNSDFYIDNYCFDCGVCILEPPQNVTAIVENQYDVHLTWEPPEEGEPVGYKIWRNDDFLYYVDFMILDFDDLDLDPGAYEYCVSAVYNEGESVMACADTVIIFELIPPGPTNLTGPICIPWGGSLDVDLTWDAPGSPEWIRWDAGINNDNGIGLTNGGTFSVASHWFPEDLIIYNGLDLLEISFYANGDPNAIYIIKVWTGANGANEVLSQEVTSFNVDDWNTVVLNTPQTIYAAEHLWYGYEVTHEAGTYPAGCDDGPAVAYKGDMFSTSGGWVSMSVEYGLDYNWNIAGKIGLDNFGSLEYYNVYRKDPGTTFFALIGTSNETFFWDILYALEVGQWEYYVTAVWNPEGESIPSNIWTVDVCTDIENVINNDFSIFPNPVSDIVTIGSDFEIINLKVYNPTGQTISEVEINNNNFILDVSQLNPGIYFLQIEFKDETILKKIIVE